MAKHLLDNAENLAWKQPILQLLPVWTTYFCQSLTRQSSINPIMASKIAEHLNQKVRQFSTYVLNLI